MRRPNYIYSWGRILFSDFILWFRAACLIFFVFSISKNYQQYWQNRVTRTIPQEQGHEMVSPKQCGHRTNMVLFITTTTYPVSSHRWGLGSVGPSYLRKEIELGPTLRTDWRYPEQKNNLMQFHYFFPSSFNLYRPNEHRRMRRLPLRINLQPQHQQAEVGVRSRLGKLGRERRIHEKGKEETKRWERNFNFKQRRNIWSG